MKTKRISVATWADLKGCLPLIAKLLDKSLDDLYVVDYDWFPREYMDSNFRDRVVESVGLAEGLPPIIKRRQQAPGRIGYGIYIYESRQDPTLRYALFCTKSRWDETYLIIPKNRLFRLWRDAVRLNKLASATTDAPVLREGLLDEIVNNTVGFLLKKKEIAKFGVKIKRGIILDGPPGNGKTMVCRYIQKLCSQHGLGWGVITSADIDDAYGKKHLNELFTQFTVSFFDDIDISYMDRTRGCGKMACSLLTAMDGMHDGGHLVRIFTTNESVKDLDKAFTRPGRIDRLITLEKPEASLRRALVQRWPQEILNNINVDICVQRSAEFSFAELEAIRTFLVTNKILGDGNWNLGKAFAEFSERQAENKKLGVGFATDTLRSSVADSEEACQSPCPPPAFVKSPHPSVYKD